jgi:hypothetical protein
MGSKKKFIGNPLIEALRRLPAAGQGSFEHLVRDLLSRQTGRRFTVAKSGPQGGFDARTEADDSVVMAVEAKRYGQATPLPLDEAKSKLRDAASANPDLELWILAASREIKEPDATELPAEGDALGVEVLLLDWPESVEVLPRLLLLCAAHQDILTSYVPLTTAIDEQLVQARAHRTYSHQLASLCGRLGRPSLGYANARDALAQSLCDQMSSMSAAAAGIGRYANLTDPSVIRIDRPTLRQAVSAWWSAPLPRPVLALLGGEGVGKTWAALSWWIEDDSQSPLPLTLVVPAKSVASTSPDEIIGNALFAAFGNRDAHWWARRARRWCARAGDTMIILILDGLNERFDFVDWAVLAAALRRPPWTNAIDLLISDRNDHWRRIVGGFQSAGAPFIEVPVGVFSTAELNDILSKAGLSRSELDSKLIKLMEVPRLCSLAIRHWERLGRSGDITPERLVYEDFRDRVYPEFDDNEIRNLIARIGEDIIAAGNLSAPILRRQIGEALAEESGRESTEPTVSALVSGVWFESIPTEPNRFRINRELAPVAMGLALTRAVQSLHSIEEIAHRIEGFVDDLRGLELGVTVVGIAASFATVWPDCTVAARETLLDTWLASDNFYRNELKRYTRLIPENPALFLVRTERVWHDIQRLHNDRNIHLAGLVNAANAYPNVMAAFVRQATIWLSETYPWHAHGDRSIADMTPSAVLERVRLWNAARGDLPEMLFVDADDGWTSVAGTTLTAMSHLPRAPFAMALGNYAVGAVIMRLLHFQPEPFEWLLRANIEDAAAAESAIIAQARELAEVDDEHGGEAADLLLDALSALDHRSQPAEASAFHWFRRESTVSTSDDGTLRWEYEPEHRNAGWGEIALRYATDLMQYAADPEASLSEDGALLLGAAFDDVLANDVGRRFDLTDEIRPVLARWAPDHLVRYLSRADNIGSGNLTLHAILNRFKESWVAHEERTTTDVHGIFQTSIIAAENGGGELDPDLVALALCQCSAAEQIAVFRDTLRGPIWREDMAALLKQPQASDFETLGRILADEENPAVLSAWLDLLSHSDLKNMPSSFAPAAALLSHREEKVRTAAMRLAYAAPDKGLCNIMRDSGWTSAQANGDEAVYGSMALARADPIPGDQRPSHILPMALGILTLKHPDEESYFLAFAKRVGERVAMDLNPPRTSRVYGHRVYDRNAYVRLVAEMPEEVEAWLQPALSGSALPIGPMLFSGEKTPVELCFGLMAAGRPLGAELWRILSKSMAESDVKSDEPLLMPFETPFNEVSDALRREALQLANLDQHLWDIASALRRQGESPWLVSAIRDLLGTSVLDHAKALVLAGELDNDPAADALWDEAILPPVLPQWLSKVRALARRRYVSNMHAKHWLTAFTNAGDAVSAFSAFDLFRSAASRTCASWATGMVVDAKDRLLPRAFDHWLFNVPALNAELRDANKKGKDQLAYTRVPGHDQAPWR